MELSLYSDDEFRRYWSGVRKAMDRATGAYYQRLSKMDAACKAEWDRRQA